MNGWVGRRRRNERGFSLVEVMIALSILSVISLGLVAMISSSQKLTSFTRERNIASNAIRAYVETMRTKTLAQVIADTTTPADYLPSGSSLRRAKGTVIKANYEDAAGALQVQGTRGSVNTATTLTSGAFSPDKTAYGYTTGGRDLDGDKLLTSAPASTSSILILPARVSLEWESGVGTKRKTVGGAESNMSMDVYVCFGY